MSLYKDLLFLHGHIADPRLALDLSAAPAVDPGPTAGIEAASGTTADATAARTKTTDTQTAWREPMTLFKSLLYLGGLESIDSRIGEEEEAFGQTYGNRVASERTFGKPASKSSSNVFHRRVVPVARNTSEPLGCA